MVVHAGQHYDYEMSQTFFDGLDIREPDVALDIPHGLSLHEQLGTIYSALDLDVDEVFVYGDCVTTLAGALYASMRRIYLTHVEAGIRNSALTFPEDVIRRTVDHLADMNMCYYEYAIANLRAERCDASTVLVPNFQLIVLDSLGLDVGDGGYILLTVHRRENATPQRVAEILRVLGESKRVVLFPCHPRTKKVLGDVPGNVIVLQPQGYVEFAKLLANASVVVTDSGGVQVEAHHLGKKCVVLAKSTPWEHTRPILVGDDYEKILGTA